MTGFPRHTSVDGIVEELRRPVWCPHADVLVSCRQPMLSGTPEGRTVLLEHHMMTRHGVSPVAPETTKETP